MDQVRVQPLLAALADERRLRIFAAVALRGGAGVTTDGLQELTGTPAAGVCKAVKRLEQAGLISSTGGRWIAVNDSFGHALAGLTGDAGDGDDLPREVFRDGMVCQVPRSRVLRQRLLARLTADFSAERSYSEREVNDVLKERYSDFATLRRYLIDDGFLLRDPEGLHYRVGQPDGQSTPPSPRVDYPSLARRGPAAERA